MYNLKMQNENRKFGIKTSQGRTDDTAFIGVNWPTTLGGDEPWVSEVKFERGGRLV